MNPHIVKMKEPSGLCDFKYGYGGPTCSECWFNFIKIELLYSCFKDKGCNQKGFWSMGEHVAPMALVFVKLDLMDQIVKIVYIL